MDRSFNMQDSDSAPYPVPSAFQNIDEGFAESQNESENGRNSFEDTAASFVSWLQTLREETRAEIALEVLRTLRTSNIAAVVDKLTPLLHMDPIEKLPPEITSQIFSYLDAKTLLTASLASGTWRERILDSRLWQQLYKSEGWGINSREIEAFEREYISVMRAEFKKARGQLRGSIGKGQPLFKKRATSNWLESKPRRLSADVAQWREQHGAVEADIDGVETADQEMPDIASPRGSPSRPNKRHSHDSGDEMDYDQESGSADAHPPKYTPTQLRANMLIEDAAGDVRVNWPYLYKQRYKLEQNWMEAKFTNFQLPHPNHPHEAHTECVYTIQFCGRWLVSGSRDKTLRVWDMETRRLRGKPLTGHSQSVLCLQFDPSEEEDVIISGSSDSSVIIWKFSTGQKVHVIPSAHEESVLNLRFDKRYLVTCSKDRKIKIWNRNTLSARDPDYPRVAEVNHARVPSYIVDVSSMEPSFLEAKIANGQIRTLQPYTHLLTLEGHHAAVNAIQINADLVVSASGDRLIRVWNVKTGVCLRAIAGHQKGIACVQFDSRRIVSGSSDNTVRIYDPLTAAEVAVLLGHSNLVRTVQAGFGDIPGSEEEDMMIARQAERQHLEDLESGRVVEDRQYMRNMRNGESGSSRTAFGSNLPPGGGGSKWGRIVSGSYDETIIIWKKDDKGNWVVGQTLKQNDAVNASSGQVIRMDQPTEGAVRPPQNRRMRSAPQAGSAPMNDAPNLPVMSTTQMVQHAINQSMSGLHNGIQNVVGRTLGLNNTTVSVTPRVGNIVVPPNTPINLLRPAIQSAVSQIASQAQAAAANAIQQAAANNGDAQVNVTYSTTTSHSVQDGEPMVSIHSQTGSLTPSTTQVSVQSDQPGQAIPPPAPLAAAANIHAAPPNGQPPAGVANPHAQHLNANINRNQNNTNREGNGSISRVFKLQFDARRIVCCSQDSRIVGWDFANGDPEIEAACEYFVGP